MLTCVVFLRCFILELRASIPDIDRFIDRVHTFNVYMYIYMCMRSKNLAIPGAGLSSAYVYKCIAKV